MVVWTRAYGTIGTKAGETREFATGGIGGIVAGARSTWENIIVVRDGGDGDEDEWEREGERSVGGAQREEYVERVGPGGVAEGERKTDAEKTELE